MQISLRSPKTTPRGKYVMFRIDAVVAANAEFLLDQISRELTCLHTNSPEIDSPESIEKLTDFLKSANDFFGRISKYLTEYSDSSVNKKFKTSKVSKILHDLKGPINTAFILLGILEELLETRSNDQTIKQSYAKFKSQLQLSIEYCSSNKEDLRKEKIDFSKLISAHVSNLSGSLKSNLALIPGTSSDKMIVFANKTQINRIITNLIKNADEAMAESKDEDRFIHVKYGNSDADIFMSVTNSLPSGFSPSILEKIRHALDVSINSAPPTFTTKATGNGIGLAVIREFTKQNGGNIFVETDASKITISLRLPLLI